MVNNRRYYDNGKKKKIMAKCLIVLNMKHNCKISIIKHEKKHPLNMEHFKAGCIFLIVHQFGPFYIKIKCFIKNKSQMIFSKSESRETNWN